MKSFKKTTFHKLYLIEPELYNRILPLLNEIDKNELIQLNQEHLEEEMGAEETTLSNIDNSKTESQKENQTMTNANTQTQVLHENQTMRNIISDPSSEYSAKEQLNNGNSLRLKSSNKQKRPKKFSCQKCIKSFTTKSSLKRHNKTFHTASNQEPQNNGTQNSEYIHSQEYNMESANIPENNKGMKRKVGDLYEDSVETKRLKPTRGVKRQQENYLDTDATDFKQPRLETSVMGLEDFSAPRGIKRQMNRITDSEPRKKTRWIDFY